jgi:L-lactate dehydrogenase complex protein LldG
MNTASPSDLFARFQAQAVRMNATVQGPVPESQIGASLHRFLRERGGSARAAPALATLAATLALPQELIAARDVQDAAAADIGVTGADLAIAETGSLVLASHQLLDRLVSMLPAVHVALLPLGNLVASLAEAAVFLRAHSVSSSYVSLVTGPSRTGDIELVHTIGVHGPAEIHILPYLERRARNA